MTGVEVRVPVQCLNDAATDITQGGLRRHPDVIQHAPHAVNVTDRFFRVLLLNESLDLSGERHVAVVDGCLNALGNARP